MKIINRLLLLFFCVTFLLAAKGQNSYAEAMQQGDVAFRDGQYKVAINKYLAAQAFDPGRRDIVKEKVNATFDKIEALRLEAILSQREADKALREVQKQKQIADSALKEAQKQKQIADSNFQTLQQLKTTAIGASYQGGVIFYWNDKTGKHGLIAAENDLGELYWQKAVDTCKTISLNGYSDWRLPTMEELGSLYANRTVVGGFALKSYWSSYDINNALAGCQPFNYGIENNWCYKSAKHRVRLIRSF